jgi:hypothetical protein
MTKFPLLAILLFVGASAFAQTQTEKEIKELLVHKWKLTEIEQDGLKVPVPAGVGDSFLDFKSDGTVLMIDSQETEKSKWSYDHKTKTVTTKSDEDEQKFEIIKISATELIIKGTMEEMTMTMYLKKVS